MTARVALGRMAADGLITLPPPRNGNGNGRHPRHGHPGQLALPLPAHPAATLADLGPVTISVVDSRQASRQWNQLIRDHHYLGYTPLAGAQIRYLAAAPAAPDRRLRLRRQRLEMRPPRRLDRLGPRHPPRQPEPDLRQRPVPHPPRPGGPQPRLLAARRRHPPAARRLAGPLRLRPGPGRDLRRRPAGSPAPATAPPTGPALARPRAGASSTAAMNTPCRSRTSTSTRCTGAGGRSSPPRPLSNSPRDHRILTRRLHTGTPSP